MLLMSNAKTIEVRVTRFPLYDNVVVVYAAPHFGYIARGDSLTAALNNSRRELGDGEFVVLSSDDSINDVRTPAVFS